MELQPISARMQLILFLLFELVVGCFLWLVWRDRPNVVLQNLSDVGALLSYVPLVLHLYYKFRPKGPQRWRWQIPDSIGFVLGWAGYFMRQEAVAESSWVLSNRGSILEIAGGLAVIYAVVVLFRMPKDQR